MLKGVKVRKVYEDEIDEPELKKKVKNTKDDTLHKMKIIEKGQKFEEIGEEDEPLSKKQENQKKGEVLYQQRQQQKSMNECKYCLNNGQLNQYFILSNSNNVMLLISPLRYYGDNIHILIVPIDHVACIRDIDDEINEEIRNYMKCLVAAFDKANMECIFYENAYKFKYAPHTVIECVAIPYKISKEANLNIYFKQGMEDLDGFWSTHKKIIEISKQKGGIRKQIPKGFAYFYVDFSLKFGYAHVIENEDNFNPNFAREIIATILQVEKQHIISPKPRTEIEAKQENDHFQTIWKNYDWTTMLKI